MNQANRLESIVIVTDCGWDPVPARGGKRVSEGVRGRKRGTTDGTGAPVVKGGGGAPALSGERESEGESALLSPLRGKSGKGTPCTYDVQCFVDPPSLPFLSRFILLIIGISASKIALQTILSSPSSR